VIICLVADRRRLCDADACSFAQARQLLGEHIGRAVDAGVDLVQIRERDLAARDLGVLVTDAVQRTRGTATRVVVNDRLDVALACAADGVHLRADSVDAADVGRLAPPGFLVGRSVHSVDEARRAGAVDYLIAGTVFPTASKPDDQPLLGLSGLSSIVAATSSPVLAIGGITLDRAAEIARTGAAGVAAIGLFIDPTPLRRIVSELGRRFDSAKSAPYDSHLFPGNG
jgi:thiamine-phosphate pyrophosphorylase